jgi:hypothetical protein
MTSLNLKVASVWVLAASCLAQDRGGVDSAVAVPLIGDVLRKANVSGSLAYWGRCEKNMSSPDFPRVRILPDYSRPPLEVLRKMFADDPLMRVTQEPGGKIRMAEADVPSDLLNVRISHLSFNVVVQPELRPAKSTLGDPTVALLHWPTKTLGGPNMALEIILSTSEVSAFKRARNIKPLPTLGFLLPGDSASKPPVPGELDNVTFSQALDYVLESFPGFWIYENCPSADGGRTVVFNFF